MLEHLQAQQCQKLCDRICHDDVIKWKHFPRYWPFVRGIHRSPVNSSHKGQWRGALILSLICVWINGWVNNHEAGDLRRYHAHYDVSVMYFCVLCIWHTCFNHCFSLWQRLLCFIEIKSLSQIIMLTTQAILWGSNICPTDTYSCPPQCWL